jgi:two-component system phosphate regulon sensor histidine kinase PhoR
MAVLWLWRRELSYLFLLVMSAAIISYFVGYFMHMVMLILLCFIIYHAILLSRFEYWLGRGARGKIPRSLGVWDDVYYHFHRIKKNEKNRKKKLAKIIEQFRKSTDVLPDATVVLGDYDEIEWSNKLAKTILGIKKSDRGQRINNLIRAPEFVEFLKKSRESKKTLTLVSPIDERVTLQFRIVNYGVGQHLVIAQDVSQQIKMEAMRKNFVDNISHELRTPLTVLKGYLETLQEMDENQSDMLTNSLTQMNAQTERMEYLVDDLLLLARLETKKKKKECVDISLLIENIRRDSEIIKKGSQRLEFELEPDCNFFGEEQDLQSAFTNLLINALKYSPDDTLVKVVWKRTSEGLVFDVIDQGEGISALDIPRVTERFYRVDLKRTEKLSGTGLGLAIVKHVLIRHDAQLKITSEVNKGSRFRCIFPASRAC